MASSRLEKLNLIDKLKNAYKCCSPCGHKYGVYSVGCSSIWTGTCDVCGAEDVPVTETRDYSYLAAGIKELTMEKQQNTDSTQLEIKYKSKIHSISITREDDHSFLGTEVRIDDEGGGQFLIIIDDDGSELRLDFEEFDLLVKAVETLRNQ